MVTTTDVQLNVSMAQKKKKKSEESNEPSQQPTRKSLRRAAKKEFRDREPELDLTTKRGDPTSP